MKIINTFYLLTLTILILLINCLNLNSQTKPPVPWTTQDWLANQWENISRTTDYTNFKDQITEKLTEAWTDGNWLPSSKIVFEYDEDDNLIKESTQLWVDNQWKETDIITYSYDDENRLIEIIYSPVSANDERETYEYDTKDRLYMITSYEKDSDEWVMINRTTYTYDSDDNQIVILFEISFNGATWENDIKEEPEYDQNGRENIRIYYYWNPDNKRWENDNKDILSYDNDDNLTEIMEQYWDEGWYNSYKTILTYNTNGDLYEWIEQIWELDQFINQYITIYNYDSKDELNEIIFREWDIDDWVNVTRIFRDEPGYVSDEKTFDLKNISLYPNPAEKNISIRYIIEKPGNVSIELIDQTGSKALSLFNQYQTEGEISRSFELNNISAGIYYVKLSFEDSYLIKKLIVIR